MRHQGWSIALAACLLWPIVAGCQIPSSAARHSKAATWEVAYQQPASASPTPDAAAGPTAQEGTSLVGAQKNASKQAKVTPDDEDEGGFDWSDLDPANIYKKIKNAVGLGPNEQIAETEFKQGMQLYREKRYDDAASHFAKAADRWPDSPLEEDALFFQAESYFFADRYGQAHDTFLILFKKYSNTRYLDVAAKREFSVGRYWEQYDRKYSSWPITPNFFDRTRPWFDTFGNSVNAYTSVQLNDPTGPLADDAVMAMGNANFDRGRYEDAANSYDQLRKNYPKSEHIVKAHLLGLEAKKLIYQGPLYDGKPLDDAQEIARQALTQFRSQLGNDRERLVREQQTLGEMKSERLWAMGEFWETKRAYGAARICYNNLIKEYPGTRFAQMAEKRLGEIKDKPAEPTNHFKWLTDTFNRFKEQEPR
jgi:TolA-binding protein